MYMMTVLTLVIASSKPVCGFATGLYFDPWRISHQSSTMINAMDLERILRINENFRGADFQFLYSKEYEGAVGQVAKFLSDETYGFLTIMNDGRTDTLNQLFAVATTATVLVLLGSPTETVHIFHKVRKEVTKSHVVNWVLIMEGGDDSRRAVTLLENLVPEGTYVRIFIKESRESLVAFLPSIDKHGVTRFTIHGDDDLESPALLRTPYDRRRPQNYSLQGRQLTIAVKESMLALVLGRTFPDGSVELKIGGEVNCIEFLSSALNFSYKAYLSPDNSWGYFLPNGTVTGIIGMVARREVDFAVSILGITQERERVVDFTAPYMGTRSMLFSRFPKEKNRALAVLSPFQFQVWICLAAAVLFIGLFVYSVSYAITTYKYQAADEKLDLNWSTFNTFRSIVLQGSYIEAGSWPTRFILFVWFVFCLIFYALYSGVLTAVLAVPTYETPIESLNDLPRAAKAGFTIGMLGGSSYESFFKMAKEGIYKQTWDLLDHDDRSKSFVNNVDEGFRRVLTERFVFIAGENYMQVILRRFGKGRYHFGREVFFPAYVGFACQSGSPIAHVFTQRILMMQATGLVNHWIDILLKRIPRDAAAAAEEGKSFAITLTHLQAGFYLAFLGLSVATVVFLLELVIFYLRGNKFQQTY